MLFVRVAFGLLLTWNVLRYAWNGWIRDLYLTPTYRFPYFGFEWVPGTASPTLIVAAFTAVGVLGIVLAHGRWHRPVLAVLLSAFVYLELLDATNYLNHYYLVSVLGLLLFFAPIGRKRGEGIFGVADRGVPRWVVLALRVQLGIVYFYAGVAKLRPDWLMHGAPLSIWLPRHGEMPMVGPLFQWPLVAMLMSWAGALFDLAAPFLLAWSRTRRYFYVVVVVFHGITAALFPIGLFPWLMMAMTTVFFPPDWLRRRLKREPATLEPCPSRPWFAYAAALLLLAGTLVPLRRFAVPGRSDWHEQGFRFSWNVMVMEKIGVTEFRVLGERGVTVVHPREELTPFQLRIFATQPDLILAYAKHLEERWQHDGKAVRAVYADAWVSLNGRERARLIDPDVNLLEIDDGFSSRPWVLPAPTDPPR